MAVTRQTRRSDTTIGISEADATRLARLAPHFGGKVGVVREALLELELRQSYVRDLVRDAVLHAAADVTPDGLYDPADDPRPEQAVGRLAALLGSMPAAEGIVMALRELSMQAIEKELKS